MTAQFRWVTLCGLLLGCSDSSSEAVPSRDANGNLIVPGVRVGKFNLGADTLASILGSDTPESRDRFAKQGINFEFEQGKQLTGVTVTDPRFRTRHGFRVGSLASDVEAQLGAPLRRVVREVNGKFELPVLAYEGITFVLSDGAVRAIRVGKP